MKKIAAALALLSITLLPALPVSAATLAASLKGRIVLQVESHGEAWYVHPSELARYYLGRPDDAFTVMRTKGIGITNANLDKIPTSDSIATGDLTLRKQLSGLILLQVQSHGEAWYVYPVNMKRYYLGRPADAFSLMRSLGLGISNTNLATIPVSPSSLQPTGVTTTPNPTNNAYVSIQSQMLTALNNARTSAGVAQVALSAKVTAAAQAQADDMTAKNYLNTTSPTGKTTTSWLQDAGYSARSIAVHIDSYKGAPTDFITRWQQQSSSQFTSVAVSSDYKEVGIGIGTVNGAPVYVVVMTLSQDDYLATQTLGLADLAKVRSDMLARVNLERQKAGLASLTENDQLQTAAQGHSEDMLNRSYYDHITPDGIAPDKRVLAAGYQFQAMGENIAEGQTSVQQVMDDWMNSPEHRDNILSPLYANVGFGLAYGKNNNGYQILWTQDFGQPRQ